MKIQTKNTKLPKILTFIAVITIVGILSYGVYAHYSSSWPFSKEVQTSSSTDYQNTPAEEKSQADTKDTLLDTDTDNPADKTPVKYDTPKESTKTPQKSNTLDGVINFKSVADGTLTIRNTIDQHTTSGTCTLTLTNSQTGKVVTKTADIIANPSSSTCKGFSIPVSELSPGKWRIAIDMVSGSSRGTLEATVNI